MTFYVTNGPGSFHIAGNRRDLKSTDLRHTIAKKTKLHIWIFRIERKCDIGIPYSSRFEKKLKGTSRIPFSNIQKTKVRKSLVAISKYSPNLFTDGDEKF